uniref:cytochrome b n=1 Tax=Neucentropus mandjuricus TaxID=1223783 RepID=UPI0021139707|nr:cytochrome b [Neucentropus mandjuricus]USL48458.1 cytochrome b [Neucentropus mandjuricus]
MNKILSHNKTHPIMKILSNNLINLPTPSNISFMWNYGSLLSMCLVIQIITGLFLSMQYTANIELSFSMMNSISRNINNGWLMRIMHSNGASMFFVCIYLHIGRNIYYESYNNLMTWNSGIIILFLLMMTAFTGYILPWGQMSFWGATVITNMISAIPYIGNDITMWIWGGFSINNATLNRFFSIHFLSPFIIMAMIMVHLAFLHQENSNNPLNLKKNQDKINFNPYFSMKDILGVVIMLSMFIMFSLNYPFLLNDSDNFIEANPMTTPAHIQPEWYFLFAYAILRSIPNKLGGVIAMMASIMILFSLPMMKKNKIMGNNFFNINKSLYWMLIMTFILLSWIGMNPVKYPFIQMGQIFSIMYFTYFLMKSYLNMMWNKMIY